MDFEDLTKTYLEAIESTLRQAIQQFHSPELSQYTSMMAYHLGWEGEGAGQAASGKRIRPLLVLLSNAAAGGHWRDALPAAAAIELVHNFSLIHDDIEDDSPTRRGRETVWVKWGIPQAINAGDAMLTVAHLTIIKLEMTAPASVALEAARILQEACLSLTQGQFLDMAYESHDGLPLDAYWQMVGGKTAALLAAGTEIGALVAGVDEARRQAYRRFGYSLGLAFQAQDDILGIWGDSGLTGKSAESDLTAGKKSLPIVFGLQQRGRFAERWMRGPVEAADAPELAALLEAEGARSLAQQSAEEMTQQALEALESANPQGEAGQALKALANQLLNRRR